MYIGFWNTRGLVNLIKQAKVRNLVTSNGLGFVGLLETKVLESFFGSISTNLLAGWCWVANTSSPQEVRFGLARTLPWLVLRCPFLMLRRSIGVLSFCRGWFVISRRSMQSIPF